MLAKKTRKHWVLAGAAVALSIITTHALSAPSAAADPSNGWASIVVLDDETSGRASPDVPAPEQKPDDLDEPSEDGTDAAPALPEAEGPPGCPYYPFDSAHPDQLLI